MAYQGITTETGVADSLFQGALKVNSNFTEIYNAIGDGLLYKGCELCHWRDPMPGKKRNKIRKWLRMKELYYHQIFMHYVLRDGLRVQCANDMSRGY